MASSDGMPWRPRTSALDERLSMAVPHIARRKRLKSVTVRSPFGEGHGARHRRGRQRGRRSLLANTLEREGFQVTRASTLRQAVGTTVATVPEVLLLEEAWPDGDPHDAAQSISSNPAVGTRTRIVLLSRDTSQEAMVSAARAGVAEVLANPSTWPASSLRCTRMLRSARWHRLRTFPCKAWAEVDSPPDLPLRCRRWTTVHGRCPCSGSARF